MTYPIQPAEPMERLLPYQADLTRFATRMLGSSFEADDAVQETMVRAWNGLDRFKGRSHIRSWLYRICTNVCLDMLASRRRRAQLSDDPAAWLDGSGLQAPPVKGTATPPGSGGGLGPSAGDPAEVAVARESVQLALATVIRHLPPKQRSVLLLREMLHWRATEVAELLDSSVASVNSALQRARATLRDVRVSPIAASADDVDDVDDETRVRLGRYVRALESSDMEALTALLADEAA